MGKDAYYFSHDSNARNDENMIPLRIKYGYEGYGHYFAILEVMRESTDYKTGSCEDSINELYFKLQPQCERIKFAEQVQYMVEKNLFVIDKNKRLYSVSFLKRMKLMDKKRKQAKDAANKRWGNFTDDADALQTESDSNAIKGKERKDKLKETKRKKMLFADFWEKYPNKKAKPKAEGLFLKLDLTDDLFNKIISSLEIQKKSESWVKDGGKFIPHPTTWLNQERWEDDLNTYQKPQENSDSVDTSWDNVG